MKSFYDFLKKFAERNQTKMIDDASRRRYENIFISYFKDFSEKNKCYLNQKDPAEDDAYEDAVNDFEKIWYYEITDKKGNSRVKEWHFEKELVTLFSEFKITCYNNYKLRKTIEEKFNGTYIPISKQEINKMLFNLLYCAESFKISSSTYNLLKWIKQTKLNLKMDENIDSNHFLLQYSSRDKNDNTSKGGTGKSYILNAIRMALSKYIDDYVLYGQGLFPTNNFIGKEFSERLFVIDDEMTSLKNINFPALKNLLTSTYYRSEEKGKMVIQRRNIANYIGASNQNYKKSYDGALNDRILEIQCDATLNLRNEDLLEKVEKYLPSKQEIGQSFINLLNIDERILDKLLEKYREKYKEEKENYGENKEVICLVKRILYLIRNEKNDKNKNIVKMRPSEIREKLNDGFGEPVKDNDIIDGLLFMEDKYSEEYIGNPVKNKNSKSANKNKYGRWTFTFQNDIDDIIDELPHFEDDISCIEHNLKYFNIVEEDIFDDISFEDL